MQLPVYQQQFISPIISQILELENKIAALEDEKTTEVVVTQQHYDKQIIPLQEQLLKLLAKLAKAENLVEKPVDGSSMRFGSTQLVWRSGKNYVEIDGDIAVVIEQLKKKGLMDLIRTKDELNKHAILENPSAVSEIRGISVQRGTDTTVLKTPRREYPLS